MNRVFAYIIVSVFVLAACDSQTALQPDRPVAKQHLENKTAVSPAVIAEAQSSLDLKLSTEVTAPTFGDAGDINVFLAALNTEFAAAGMNIAVDKAEFVTDLDSAEPGQTVFANDRTKQLTSKWVPNDARRNADGENVTYVNFLPLSLANGAINSDPIIDASFATFNNVTCSALPIVKRQDDGTFPSAIFAGGDPFVADIVELGFIPGVFFDLVLGPGASNNVLGVTFTFIFGSFDAEGNFTPSDVDSNGRTDTALKEVWYNDSFLWTDTGSGGVDIETVALHENGHALEMGHFGKVFVTGNGKLHVSPRAVMNAFILGTQRELLGTDNASHCSNFASWPNS
ncbi:MAG: hypothetical protein HKN43_15295 [Rhodothermales bacterium]|nr:hypothetical protein [Rhodothermales bacterium]